MSKLVLSINISVDGFADHTVALHADDEMHDFFTNLLENTGIAIFGRVTFELMQEYWPHAHDDPAATASTLAFADRYNAIPKVVFSRTLKNVSWNNARIERGNLIDEVIRLKKEPGKAISIGGIQLARHCMQQNLIDEYWFVVHPVVVGHGKRMFDGVTRGIALKPLDTTVFHSGVSVLHYAREDE